MNFQQFSESENSVDYLAQIWISNYAYNTLSLNQLIESINKWYNYIFGITGKWKWIYGKNNNYRLTLY